MKAVSVGTTEAKRSGIQFCALLSKESGIPITEVDRPEVLALFFVGLTMMFARLGKNIATVYQTLAEGVVIRRLGSVAIVVSDTVSAPFSTLIGFRAFVVVPSGILQQAKDFPPCHSP